MEELRYPIGRFTPQPYSDQQKEDWIGDIRFLPQVLEASILNLDAAQLATPYREEGWTVHQVVHHVADSHMNAFCRFKLGFSEREAVIRPYNEGLWAQTADVEDVPVNVSLTLLHALHQRWTALLNSFEPGDWNRTVFHPQHQKTFTLWDLLGTYAWHGRHHAAHINGLRERQGWH